MTTCMRCYTLGPTTRKGPSPHLLLCATCDVTAFCGEYHHQFQGSPIPGTWVCVDCGATLGSQALTTTRVEANQAPAYDYDC